MTAEDFLERRVAPLYGGEEAARMALEIATRVGPIREGQSPKDLPALIDLAYRGRRVSADYARARWDKLIRYVSEILPE